MDIVEFRGRMTAVLAALSLASAASFAQTPAGSPSRTPGDGGKGGVAAIRPAAPQPQGLANPALKLTDSQKARIDQIVESYLAEQTALSQQYATAPNARLSNEATAAAVIARKQSRARLEAAVEQVLDASQRKTLKESQLELRASQFTGRPEGATGDRLAPIKLAPTKPIQ